MIVRVLACDMRIDTFAFYPEGCLIESMKDLSG